VRRIYLSLLLLAAPSLLLASGAAFNPAILLILDGRYSHEQKRGEMGWSSAIEHVAGFVNPHDHSAHSHAELPPGFHLYHAELIFSANIDHLFEASLNLGIDEAGVAIEESYITTRQLPAGIQLKLGKFLSGIGYQNQQHSHDWSFTDIALPYQLLFGSHGLNEKGIQLTWTPLFRHYTLFGMELLQGENEAMANYLGAVSLARGQGSRERSGPRLWSLFARFAPEMGFNHAMQLSLFGGQSLHYQAREGNQWVGEGEGWFGGAAWVYKYDRGGYRGDGSITLMAEYLLRQRQMVIVGSSVQRQQRLGEMIADDQDGFYLQAIYGMAPRWQLAVRHEVAGLTNRQQRGSSWQQWHSSERSGLSLTWLPSEFSRLRLQYSQSALAQQESATRLNFSHFTLQYQVAMGVHGAHRF
jgi:hypothetical protein